LKLSKLFRHILAIACFFSLLAGAYALFPIAKGYIFPVRLSMLKMLKQAGMGSGMLAEMVTPPPLKSEDIVYPSPGSDDWQGHGARPNRILQPLIFDADGRPVPNSWNSSLEGSLQRKETKRKIIVNNAEEFLAALLAAQAGDVIALQPGTYTITKKRLHVSDGGTAGHPVIVQAEKLGQVFLELDTYEGFYIDSPYWAFENLDIKGTCGSDDDCNHAFHIVGSGRGFVLRNSRIHEFNSPIKANAFRNGSGEKIYPDGILLEANSFYNARARRTSSPVSFIDVVGVNHFIVSNNLIADFQKDGGDHISYGAQIKGNSASGVFEKNLVVCEYVITGGVRVGLSLGGGGSGKEFFRDNRTEFEHTNGMVRNNIVMYCSDVGLYLNKAKGTKVLNNTFYETTGIDVRFPESTALVVNNLVSGRIWDRNGGTSVRRNNLVRSVNGWPFNLLNGFRDWFVNPAAGNFAVKAGQGKDIVDRGEATGLVWDDFCGNARDPHPDIGAIEYGSSRETCHLFGEISKE
jgi:parallel beta-helix repeat protein